MKRLIFHSYANFNFLYIIFNVSKSFVHIIIGTLLVRKIAFILRSVSICRISCSHFSILHKLTRLNPSLRMIYFTCSALFKARPQPR
jgi:hypothetical protein